MLKRKRDNWMDKKIIYDTSFHKKESGFGLIGFETALSFPL